MSWNEVRVFITLVIVTLSVLALANCQQATPVPSYTVTYNGNGATGGTVPTDPDKYNPGKMVTALPNSGNLTDTGFSFTGWNTQSNGKGVTYTPGQTFAMGDSNVTLFALWTIAPTSTVTYNGNGNTGGTVPTDSKNYLQGATVTVLGNTGSLTKTGYTFVGWAANGSGTIYSSGQTLTMGSTNMILYAQWTALPTHTVTYNGNGYTGGSVPIDPNNYTQGQTVTVMGNTGNLVNAGYSFAGWNTQQDGSGTSYSAYQTFQMNNSNVILYAVWKTYSVTYYDNGATSGTVPVDTNKYVQGQQVTVLGNTGNLAETGYSIASWNTQQNGGGNTYYPGQTFTIGNSNVALYATWIPSTPGIAFTATNGNTAFMVSGYTGTSTSVIIPAYWNEQPVVEIGGNAFYRCTTLTSITIPSTVTSIDSTAFFMCSGLTTISIPNGVTYIGAAAFSSCSGLTAVTIPNSVTYIGDAAFSSCLLLTTFTIPSNVVFLGLEAFSGCSALTTVIVNPTTPPTSDFVAPGFFFNSPVTTIDLPASSFAQYQASKYWSAYLYAFVPY